MEITLDQFCKQWLRLGPASATVSHFERQVFDFTHIAGSYSKDRFKQSFEQGGFYKTGEKWPERTSRWGRKFQHPIMNHSGLLKSSIDGVGKSNNKTIKPAPGRKAEFSRSINYTIEAKPESVAWPGRRGVRSNGPTTYAAVHNAPASFGLYTNQYRKSRPVRRQFMGLNKALDAEIARYYNYIFNGLPGIGNAPA